MKLIVANDVDEWIVRKRDIRAWTHRMLWFAENDDVVIAPGPFDPDFVDHVCSVVGVDPDSLRLIELASGRADGMVDHSLLREDRVRSAVAEVSDRVEAVTAAWASPHVANFVDALGLGHRWPGAAAFSQGAVELFNSLASFRALAVAAGAPIAPGTVCRSLDDALAASRALLADHGAIVIKKAHGGAGAGNHIIRGDDSVDVRGAGGRFVSTLRVEELADFWHQRWEWASADHRYPVVVESFVRSARSLYAEFNVRDEGVAPGAIGELVFRDRAMASETVPAQAVPEAAAERLSAHGFALSQTYWQLGYRGPLSADAVLAPDGGVVFTEVNAQYTGSTHLYGAVLRCAGPGRIVTQLTTPEEWRLRSARDFLEAARRSETLWDARSRRGVVLITPRIGSGDTGPLVFAIVHENPEETGSIVDRLAAAVSL